MLLFRISSAMATKSACYPGQPEAHTAALTARHGGLLFARVEVEAFNEIAHEDGEKPWNITSFKTTTV
jgi:hypothetical protein